MEDREIRAALDGYWAASDANDFEGEHQIYREDAVLGYPQSGLSRWLETGVLGHDSESDVRLQAEIWTHVS